jgi:uncharacterized membrane protein YkoI
MRETKIGVNAMLVSKMPKYALVAGVFGLLAAIVFVLIVLDRVNASPQLTIDDAIEQVRDAYEGDIVSVDKSDDDYQVKLKSATGLYALIVKSDGSGIADIRRIEAYDSGVITPSNPPEQGKNTLISEDEAVAIALEHVNGVIEEVELKRSGDIRYYLIEVETPDGREADVQLNAASGAVMSITWSNDDDDTDDDD